MPESKKLATHFSVFLIDQRNHGRSPHAAEMNYAVLAEDLKVFMEGNWIYESHIEILRFVRQPCVSKLFIEI